MTEVPELIRLNLNLHEDTVVVQGVVFNGQCPTDLNFDHIVGLADVPCLNISEASSHLIALIYELPESTSEFTRLGRLVQEGNEYKIAIFSDPAKAFGLFYILAYCDDQKGLGKYITGAKFGLFLYHYKEVLGEDVKNYIAYIRVIKIAKSNLIKKTQTVFREIEEKKEEKKHYEEIVDYLGVRAGRLKDELETAKLAVQQLNYQLEKKNTQLKERQEQSLECLICKAHMKNIVFLPCGHIILCKDCLIEMMNAGTTNGNKRTKPIKCPSCKNPVKETKEVHF